MANGFNKFLSQLKQNSDAREITNYEVTEHFEVNGERTYKLKNLDYELELGMILFFDDEMIIATNSYVLNVFLVSSLLNTDYQRDLTKLYFESGYITIKTIY